MAGWFVDPLKDKVMEKIIDAGFEYLKDQVRWQTGMKEELQRLRDLHPKIQAVVFAASQQQIGDQNSAFNKWLWQLRDAIDEADDVLDEFEYLKYKEQLDRNKEKTKELHCTSFLLEGARKFFERALKIDPNLKRLEEAVHKLINVSAEVSEFLTLFKIEKQEEEQQQLELYKTRETGALPTNYFIGRRDEKEKILQWLRNSSNEDQSHITSSTLYKNISLLSIVGHGGMGKTALSQHVYNNVMENEFDVKMWVCVSPDFDVKRVIAGMLESHTKSKFELDTLDALQGKLKYEVMAKKFLLVLDDIWEGKEEKDKSKWEKVFAPLAFGSLGSNILLTTRMDSVALMIAEILSSKAHKTLKLEGLEDDECLELLNSQAFATVENPDAHKKSILEQIVKKVLGSPLAAKVIGGVLRDNMKETYWRKILDSDIGSIEQSQNILFPILRLSYMFLPKPLQSCFSLCSIFPQDHEFDKDDLIRMWIALNFIQPSSNTRETLEGIGERYFDILVKKSFFEKFQHAHSLRIYYKMHDLLHELAQFVSARECCRVMGDEELQNCETIRHLSVETDGIQVLRKIKKFKKLRSLFLNIYNDKDFAAVLSEIFKALSSIRLLVIHAECQMPEAIGDLIHLRYLKCDNSLGEVTQLPRSICTLYHMYFIIYIIIATSWRYSLPCDFLPRDMNNLFNLRYVELPWEYLPKMHWIGELQPFQKLNNFFVKNEAGYRINELKHMNELCELRIYQLENVKDAEEACSAKFCDKGSLTDLSLHWGDDTGHRNKVHSKLLDEEVFDKLKPHNNLKRLRINTYMGTRSAKWMNDVNFISKIESITLEGCLEWQTLPPFGQLHFLKSLYLYKMPKVKSIDYIPSLELLHIEDLYALEDWFDAAAAAANDSLFPCLTELRLRSCPKLQMLPYLPPNLKKLEMNEIRWKGFSWRQYTRNLCNVQLDSEDFPGFDYLNGQFIDGKVRICDSSELLMEPLRSFTSVIELTISQNDELVSFPVETEEWFLQVSSSLLKLKFMNLESLQSLPTFLKSLSSLEYLNLSDIPLLKSLPDLPSSLEKLYVKDLLSLECLPSLTNIFSLKRLSLELIPLLESLPHLPPSLEELSIKYLLSLKCLPSSFSTFSSLKNLELSFIPLLNSLSVLPPSLEYLCIENLESLECLPSCLPTFSSLKNLQLSSIPLLKSLTVLPPSLEILQIQDLKSLECLPSLSTFSSLKGLSVSSIPLLKSLPELPLSLESLCIHCFYSWECLPSFLSTTSITHLEILNVPLLQQLPDLPSSLERLTIEDCHKELRKRYDKISGFERYKLARIPSVEFR